MKCSVILAVFNGSSYLVELLESLKNQTRKIDEVLIFDDKSTDNSPSLIKDYIETYNLNWKFFINNENVGWQNNFANGICKASYDVIFPCDQDDIWENDKVERIMDTFEKNKELLLVSTDYKYLIEENGKQSKIPRITSYNNGLVKFNKRYIWILRPGCTMAFSCKLKDIFAKFNGKKYPHDAILWTIATALSKHMHMDYDSIQFRRHGSNASNNYGKNREAIYSSIKRNIIINDYLLSNASLSKKKLQIIKKVQKFLKIRLSFYEKRRFILAIILMFKFRYYLSFKKCLMDIYICLFR